MKKNLPVTDNEVAFDGSLNILSTTDLKGAVSYVNADFVEISGFAEDELIGRNHNIVRHPDMPPAAFAGLWETVKSGESWMGIVKNRCKNGDYYWVDAFVSPISHEGSIVEYQSVRRKPSAEHVTRAKQLYPQLMDGKLPRWLRRSRVSLTSRLYAAVGASAGGTAMISGAASDVGVLSAAVGAVGGALVGSGAAWWAMRPWRGLVQRARAVKQDLVAQWIYTGRCDEFGEVALAMKALEATAGSIVGRVADASQVLESSATELDETLGRTEAGIGSQFQETEQVATAMNEMTASIQEVAQRVTEVAGSADTASSETKSGQQVLQDATRFVGNLRDSMDGMEQVIKQLQQDANDISSVVDVINGIAEQTNLLALNAAIEAARAGEQGRGFAVVADEVRTLASRTQQSTVEIQAMIEKLQDASGRATSAVGESKVAAGTTADRVNDANASLTAITEVVKVIKEMTDQIAVAATEQSSVAEEVNERLTGIRDTADSGVGEIARCGAASRRVSALSKGLSEVASQFWAKQ